MKEPAMQLAEGSFPGWGAAKARKHLGAVKAVEAGKLAGAQ